MPLPSFLGLKSIYNNNFLRFISEDSQVHGFLQFSSDEVVTTYSKFKVEVAKTGNGSYVHLRSVYNNKYWVRWSKNHYWILAAADEPNEDLSSWSCTLFEPLRVDYDVNMIRFRHVQLNHYACLWRISAPFDSCLFAASPNVDKDHCDVVYITDLEKYFMLPKHILFKGDNNSYLAGQLINKHPYLQYSSNDIKDPTVWYEVFINNDGSVGVKSDHFGKFWRRSSDWIWADSDDSTTTNLDTVFWPIEVENNVATLRNLKNNNYCKRLTVVDLKECLSASVNTITKEAKMQLEEPVVSRLINNVQYRLADARISGKSEVVLSSETTDNNSTNPSTVTYTISYSDTRTSAWNSTISRKLFNHVILEGKTPYISNGNITISGKCPREYNWGEDFTTTNQVESSFTTTVPPNTRIIIKLSATKATVDIPFTYTQKDTLLDGKEVTYKYDDGLCTSSNLFDLNYEVKQVPLVEE